MDKETKYAKLLDDMKINQWTGHVFGVEVGSRGYVAKSLGFALQKLGFKQLTIGKLRKAISLICIRCSYSIYLSRKCEIWRPWEAQHFKSKGKSGNKPTNMCSDNPSIEAETFCGFEDTEIQEASKDNQRRLKILCEGNNTFQGFETHDVENSKK